MPKTKNLSNCCGRPVIEYPSREPHYRCSDCREGCDLEPDGDFQEDDSNRIHSNGEDGTN